MKSLNINVIKLKKTTPYWWEYVLIAISGFVMLLLYIYSDFQSLTVWSTYIWDCLFDGNLYDYYQVVHENAYRAIHAYNGFNYLSLIPWSVWDFPIWLIQRLTGAAIVDHTLMLAWSKLFLVFSVGIIVYYSNKIICCFLNDDITVKWSNYMIITSPFLFIAVFLAGQSDIIIIAITVMAVYYLLQGKKMVFLVLMAFSISAKPFFIFSYIAVILLIEKNILKILVDLIISIAPMLIFNFIYANAPLYQESVSAGTAGYIIEKTVENGIPATGQAYVPAEIAGKASIVVLGMIFIYFTAYCINYTERKKNYIIYMLTAPMLVYMAFSDYEHYRKVYLLPFLIILFAINKKFWHVNILLEKILEVTGVIMVLFKEYAFYLPNINQGLMKRLGIIQDVSKCKYTGLARFLGDKTGENFAVFQIICVSIFVAIAIILMFINLPYVARRLPEPKWKCSRAIYWVDSVFIFLLIGLLFLCYFNLL